MRPPRLRVSLPWLIGFSLVASLACLSVAVYLGLTARTDAALNATREVAAQSDAVSRQIEADLTLFDFALREAANQARRPPTAEAGKAPAVVAFPELALTSKYIGFMNVLNEVGDVVADSRPNVSRPANFEGRDYFQGHKKNPADILKIGRPFAIGPDQHASIPLSRRLNRPDGTFMGVVVAGVRLTWLSDLLSRPSSPPFTSMTIRRDDGVILMRIPADPDTIGRSSTADPAWQAWLRTGLSPMTSDTDGIRLFRRFGAPPLVLELALGSDDLAAAGRSWLLWLPPLIVVPGLGALGLGFLALRLLRRGDQIRDGANAANDHHGRLIATLSHELRTPLTGILGQAEMIAEEGVLNDRQTTRLTRLVEAGTLMRDIVNRVTDNTRPGGGFEPETPVACELDRLIGTCMSAVEVEAAAKGLELTVGIDPSAPRRAMLARGQVQQVLNNLLKNAVKFTARGTVTLRVSGSPTSLRFEVSDTGPGIPKGKQSRLFNEYDRLDVGPQVAGSGLGLWTTQGLVHAMGGLVGYDENPGGGSIFWVTLHTSPAVEPDVSPITNKPPEPPADLRHLRVLVADDSDITRGVTTSYLRSAGHIVTEVLDGEPAVAEVQKRDYDLLLTDMRMPVVDGLEATRLIRALPGHRGRTPVVLVTADMSAIGRVGSDRTGVDFCLKKPFTRNELLTAVGQAALLTPSPNTMPSDDHVLDYAILDDLRQSSDAPSFANYLNMTAHRIADLLALLERPDATQNPTVRDEVHDLIGVTGLLGLATLSACLRQFDIARDRAEAAIALRGAAAAALRALRREHGPEAASGLRPETHKEALPP